MNKHIERKILWCFVFILIVVLVYLFCMKTTTRLNELFRNKPENITIVSVYAPTSYFGFGDYIRGLITLYKIHEGPIVADYTMHDISHFFDNKLHEGKLLEIPNESEIKQVSTQHELQCAIETCVGNTLFIYNNVHFGDDYTVSQNILDKIAQIFVMNSEFESQVNAKLNSLGFETFAILHIRINDDNVTENNVLFPRLDDHINSQIIPHWNRNVLVVSNSKYIKNKIIHKYGFKQFHINPVHTGGVGIKEANQLHDVMNTLIEFMIISKSNHIYQYNEAIWQTSGFSKRSSEIYDIPFTKI
jgi:hypothetical protein